MLSARARRCTGLPVAVCGLRVAGAPRDGSCLTRTPRIAPPVLGLCPFSGDLFRNFHAASVKFAPAGDELHPASLACSGSWFGSSGFGRARHDEPSPSPATAAGALADAWAAARSSSASQPNRGELGRSASAGLSPGLPIEQNAVAGRAGPGGLPVLWQCMGPRAACVPGIPTSCSLLLKN